MQKKVGIVTHYYKSINYGGNLQAYALCNFLQTKGYDAEQICFLTTAKKKEPFLMKMKRLRLWGFGKTVGNIYAKLKKRIFKKGEQADVAETKIREAANQHQKARQQSFECFNQSIIPHSEEVYYADTVGNSAQVYDIFVTGSDQVWNLNWYHPIYFLDFLPKGKTKISYAASIAMERLNVRHKRAFKSSLKDFKAISLREQSAVKMIEHLVKIKPQCVLDPTLLLGREDWNKICKESKEENYVFCYFLGNNTEERNIAEQFARKNGLKIIAILQPGEAPFGDLPLYDASPEEFLGCVKNAKYVFTDSFHAVVFSYIYQRQYFVFNRSRDGRMSSRLVDVLDLFGASERFCMQEKETLAYVEGLSAIDYTRSNERFKEAQELSVEFLLNSLEG